MRLDYITLFPKAFWGPFAVSIIKRAIENDIVEINVVDLRDFTNDHRKTVDDAPYGGGAGMLMKVEPLFKAVNALKTEKSKVIFMTPQGKQFAHKDALSLAKEEHLIFICGHYEGVDERVREEIVDEEFSIGDYVLTNGNLPAMVVTDALMRQIPGVLGSEQSLKNESFNNNLLEYPQYTRPANFNGMRVPDVLLSGNHAEIETWRLNESIKRTKIRRPDILEKYL